MCKTVHKQNSSVKLFYKNMEQTMENQKGCLEIFALGRSRGKSDFSEGRSHEWKSDYPKDLPAKYDSAKFIVAFG